MLVFVWGVLSAKSSIRASAFHCPHPQSSLLEVLWSARTLWSAAPLLSASLGTVTSSVLWSKLSSPPPFQLGIPLWQRAYLAHGASWHHPWSKSWRLKKCLWNIQKSEVIVRALQTSSTELFTLLNFDLIATVPWLFYRKEFTVETLVILRELAVWEMY